MGAFSIQELDKNNKDYVNSVLKANEDIFGRVYDDFTFYEIDKNDKLIGFFAISEDEGDIYLSGVYIKKSFRRQGAFNFIVKYLRHTYRNNCIYLNTVASNDVAIKIYSNKFKFIENKNGVIWYMV